MAPLQDISNNKKPKCCVCFEVAPKYATTCKCNGNKTLGRDTLNQLWQVGLKHLNLWMDGVLYPLGPRTRVTLTFQLVSSFLEYAGEGHDSLLGYCNRLSCNDPPSYTNLWKFIDCVWIDNVSHAYKAISPSYQYSISSLDSSYPLLFVNILE